MFKWFGQRTEKKEQKTGQLLERGIHISPVFKQPSRRAKNKKTKTLQLWEREFNTVKDGLDAEQVIAFVDDLIDQHKVSQEASAASVRSLLQTTVTNAEQMAASIKMRAQADAESEAAMIISRAEQEADETRRRALVATQKEVEAILSVATRKAEITEIGARHNALLFLLKAREELEKEVRADYKRAYSRLSSSLQNLMSEGQNIEAELKNRTAALWESKNLELREHEATMLRGSEEVMSALETLVPTETEIAPDITSKEEMRESIQLQKKVVEESIEERVEEPVQLQEKTIEERVEEPVQLQEKAIEERVEESMPLTLDSEALYTGEVELIIGTPVELKAVSRLYDHLQKIPELRILYTRGSWDRGTTISVVLEKPMPLINILSETPDVEVTAKLPEKDSVATGRTTPLLRGGDKIVKRIELILKYA